jgi:hypothetical protein
MSEGTIVQSVTSPATTHAVMGRRVLTGRPAILIMAIPSGCPPFFTNAENRALPPIALQQ